MNPDLRRDGSVTLRKGSVHVLRRKLLWDGACHEQMRFTHHGREPVELEAGVAPGRRLRRCVRVARRRSARGAASWPRPQPTRRRADASATWGSTAARRRTLVRFDPTPAQISPGLARFVVRLAPGEQCSIRWQIACETPGASAPVALDHDNAWRDHDDCAQRTAAGRCVVASSNPMMNRWLERSGSDLDMLTTALPSGPYPYAGVPWFCTTFGRDGADHGATSACGCGPSWRAACWPFSPRRRPPSKTRAPMPSRARSCTRRAAARWRNTREVPFGALLRLGRRDAAVRGAGRRLLATHRPTWNSSARCGRNITAALQWIDRYGDCDGDGFVEYARRSGDGLVQQGWKDSHDSVFHADGRMARRRSRCARCRATSTRPSWARPSSATRSASRWPAARWRREARAMQAAVPAALLVRGHRPVRAGARRRQAAVPRGVLQRGPCVVGGHRRARARRRALRNACSARDLFSGWGVRTLALGTGALQPDVVPQRLGLAARQRDDLRGPGALRPRRCGTVSCCARPSTARCTSRAARLPELFCGFQRRDGEGPTRYPVACSPQAWASRCRVRHAGGLPRPGVRRQQSLRAPALAAAAGIRRLAAHRAPARGRCGRWICCCSATATASESMSRSATGDVEVSVSV